MATQGNGKKGIEIIQAWVRPFCILEINSCCFLALGHIQSLLPKCLWMQCISFLLFFHFIPVTKCHQRRYTEELTVSVVLQALRKSISEIGYRCWAPLNNTGTLFSDSEYTMSLLPFSQAKAIKALWSVPGCCHTTFITFWVTILPVIIAKKKLFYFLYAWLKHSNKSCPLSCENQSCTLKNTSFAEMGF